MLGFFTDPYPDEVLYSAIARYHERVRYRGTATTLYDLFGVLSVRVSVDLPSRLQVLISRLPPNHSYTVDRLIDEHTLLPYFTAFLPPTRVARLREEMIGDGGQSIHGRLGSYRRRAPVERLRYCPVCVEDDRREYGEPYWHRAHQLPGNVACPDHAVFFESSGVVFYGRSHRDSLVTARRAISEPVAARRLDPNDRNHQIHLRLANDAAWLLRQKGLSIAALRPRYLRSLQERSLASRTGIIHLTDLRQRLKDFYAPVLLESLSCGLSGEADWLESIVRKTARTRHPLCHLLLINFLGYSAEQLFALPEGGDDQPFGAPPFPCLNLVAGHYREPRIAQVQIDSKVTPEGRLKATFACPDCGFTYRRYGRDDTGEGRYTFDRVVRCGEVWDEAFRRCVSDAHLTIMQMGTRLGVSRDVVRTRIKRMGLKGRGGGGVRPPGRQKDSSAVFGSKRARSRAAWLRALDQHPDEGRKALAARVPRAFNWLIAHDKLWYEAHAPTPRSHLGGRLKYDRERRDAELAVRVSETIERIKNQSGRPVRASKTAVMRELKVLDLMTKWRNLIPRTFDVLESQTESCEQFAVRRLERVTRCLLAEKVRASRGLLIKRAVLRHMVHAPCVKAALDKAVDFLERACDLGWEGDA